MIENTTLQLWDTKVSINPYEDYIPGEDDIEIQLEPKKDCSLPLCFHPYENKAVKIEIKYFGYFLKGELYIHPEAKRAAGGIKIDSLLENDKTIFSLNIYE